MFYSGGNLTGKELMRQVRGRASPKGDDMRRTLLDQKNLVVDVYLLNWNYLLVRCDAPSTTLL